MPPTSTFEFDSPVILIGGGDIDWERLEYVLGLGHPVVAVDSGADALRSAAVQPDVIIGDMDSISDTRGWPAQTEIVEIPEQDSTDFEKALNTIFATLYLAFGFFGQRLDHSLAALHCLAKYRTRKSIVLIDRVDLMFAPAVPLCIDLPRNIRLSINPLAPVTFHSSTGLRYPLDGLTLEAGVAIGTSNTVTGTTVSVIPENAERADYLVVLPNTAVAHVLDWYSGQSR
jgi:thiamine pyrophosphokinase